MKYAIISDIHANLEALNRVLTDAAEQGAQQIVCLGDVVGYGPLPSETVARVRETCALVLAGNHDDAVSGRGDASAFINLAGDAVQRHREALAADALTWLKALPYAATVGEALAVHGDAVDPGKFYYVEDTADATANFKATDVPLLFVGHTHVPCLFLVGRSGTVYQTEPQDFTLEDGKRYIVNPGSVGYPRESNGECYSSYVLYDSEERSVSFRFLPFSVASVMQRGQSPRKIRKSVLVGLLLLVALLAGAASFLLRKEKRVVETETETIIEKVEVDKSAARLVDTRTLTLDAGVSHVRANLVLAKGSAKALLTVRFLDAAGKELNVVLDDVTQKSAKKIPVPKGARTATFSVSRLDDNATVTIATFTPAGS